jgi:hypothetical protein
MKLTTAVLNLLILISLSGYASADDFRCPNGNLVSTGQSVSEVQIKCDPPSNKVKLSRHVVEWTYNQGPHKFVYFLIFKKGILTEIRSGSFGR